MNGLEDDSLVLWEALEDSGGIVQHLGQPMRVRPGRRLMTHARSAVLRRDVSVECVHAVAIGEEMDSLCLLSLVPGQIRGLHSLAATDHVSRVTSATDLLLTRSGVWRVHWQLDGSYRGISEITAPVDIASARARWAFARSQARQVLPTRAEAS